MSTSDGSIRENVVSVRERITRAALRSGRPADAVRLVAVTKRVEVARVIEAIAAGVFELGENYVQEAREKIPEVNAVDELSKSPIWHLIGQLQSNKAKYAVKLFSVIQSVDNYQLAQEISRQAAKQERTALCQVLIEVQLGAGEGRGGVAASGVLPLAEQISGLPHLQLQGLMGIAPYGVSQAETRPYFEQMRLLWEALPPENRQTLSMGMSGDFETAIEEGATLVRIGTALFGARKANTGI